MLPIRLAIADRRPIVLQGFASLFAAERDFDIVASCMNGADCLEALRRLTPDVVLVEDGFSDVTASELLAAVNAENLPTRLVFYTASVAHGELATAIEAGACSAIPMREEPDALIRSLRLVAPPRGRPVASKAGSGASGANELAALTEQERKIMRLVACGMSNKEIARRLKVTRGTIEARLDRISAQLEIKSRTELATFALSRLFGGIGALAALIWAALDDDASAAALDQGNTDSVTVMAADGTGAIVTIKITLQKAPAAPANAVKAVGKAGRINNSLADMPVRTTKPVDSRADIAASTINLPTLTPARPGLSSFATFMMTAAAVLIYEFLNSPAEALTVRDSLSDFLVPPAASGAGESAALDSPGTADATLSGFDDLAWLNPETHRDSFVFEAVRSDADGRHDEFQAVDAAGSDYGANGNPHVGSGAVDAPIGHSGLEQAAAIDASVNAEHDTRAPAAADEPDRDQSQRDLHASDQGLAAGKPHAEKQSQGHDANHGKSQHDVQGSEDSAPAAKPHAKHDPTGHDSSHGQSHRDAHASEAGSATADEAHLHAAKYPHAAPGQNADGNSQAADASGPAQTTAAPQRGDSFHFKHDMAGAKAPDHSEDGHRADSIGYAPHDAENHGLAQMQDADLFAPSHAEPAAVDHASGIEHHLTHDLLI